MTVAVTGGTGFVGSHLVSALLARGERVRCLVRAEAGARRVAEQGAEPVRGDLADGEALGRLVAGAAVVYHVAGVVAARDEAAFLRTNRDGVPAVAAAMRRAGAGRFLLVSSLAATGPTVPGRPLDESAAPHPVTAYGRSKLEGEEAARASGLLWTIVRPCTVYGPRDRELLRLFRLARRGVVPLLGDGRQELSLVLAADLAEALVAAADAPSTAGRVYHAAHEETLTQRELAQAIGRAVGRRTRLVSLPRPVVRAALAVFGAAARWTGTASVLDPMKAPELLAPAWTCRSEALRQDAGWRARTPHAEGLRQTAEWYAREGWL